MVIYNNNNVKNNGTWLVQEWISKPLRKLFLYLGFEKKEIWFNLVFSEE